MVNKPIKKYSAGTVKASIWENKKMVNGAEVSFFNVGLERSYKDGDEWKTTNSYQLNDIASAILVLQKSFEFLRLKEEGQ